MARWIRIGVIAVVVAAGMAWSQESRQSDPRGKSHTLHGTVEGIYDASDSLRVRQEKIPGYSEARVATYRVDDPAILSKVELDDKIVATIYEKDNVLYDIRVVVIDDRVSPLK
jgi:hypothetical protein